MSVVQVCKLGHCADLARTANPAVAGFGEAALRPLEFQLTAEFSKDRLRVASRLPPPQH